MKKLTFIASLFFVTSLFGAVGGIKSVNIEANGWVLNPTVDTIGISPLGSYTNGNGFFHLGLGNYNSGPSAVVLTLNSLGYNSSGSVISVPRTIYGTKQLRAVYPNQTNNDITASGGDAVIRLALSDYVYSSDSSPSLSVAVNWYSNAIASTTIPTINSTVAYPKIIGNLVVEQCRPVNGTQSIEIYLDHKYANSNSSIAKVSVTATGATSSHIETDSATSMTLSSRGDKWVYSITLNLSISAGFARGEQVDIDFIAFPKVGSSGAKLQASVDGDVNIWELCQLHWVIMDKMITVVDPATTDDTTGFASTNQSTADAHPFKTIPAAITAIQGTNNNVYSLNIIDGGEVQCKAGTYKTGKYGAQTSSKGYFTICSHASANQSTVIFDDYVTSQYQYAYERYYNVTFSRAANGYIVFAANPNVLIMEKVAFLDSYGSWYSGDTGTDIEFLDCVTTNSNFSKGGNDGHCRLIRNCTYSNICNASLITGQASCVFGIYGYGATGTDLWNPLFSGRSNCIVSFVKWLGLTDNYFINGGGKELTNISIANNLIERIGASATPIIEISDANCANIQMHDNSFAGQRVNHENDITAGYVNKTFVDYIGRRNIFNARGDHRADIRDTDGTMIGTWSVGYSVGWENNWNEAIAYSGDTDFWGMYCNDPGGFSYSSSQPVGYTSDRSKGGADVGYGSYIIKYNSQALLIPVQNLGLFGDLVGKPRTLNDPSGAYGFHPPTILVKGIASHNQKGSITTLQP